MSIVLYARKEPDLFDSVWSENVTGKVAFLIVSACLLIVAGIGTAVDLKHRCAKRRWLEKQRQRKRVR